MCESIQKSTARWMKWRKTGTDRQRLCCSRAKVRKVFDDEDEGEVELVTSATNEDEEDCEGDAEEDEEEVHRATFTQKRSMWKVVPRRKVS